MNMNIQNTSSNLLYSGLYNRLDVTRWQMATNESA